MWFPTKQRWKSPPSGKNRTRKSSPARNSKYFPNGRKPIPEADQTRIPAGGRRSSPQLFVVVSVSEKPGQILAGYKSRFPGLEPARFAVALDRRQVTPARLIHFLRRDPIFLERRNRPYEKTPDRLLNSRRGILEPPSLNLRVQKTDQRFRKRDVLAAHGFSIAERTEESM